MSRKITVTEKHRAVKQGLMAESEFTRQMRQLYPMYITQFNGFKSDWRLNALGFKSNNDFKSNRGDVKTADTCSHKTKY